MQLLKALRQMFLGIGYEMFSQKVEILSHTRLKTTQRRRTKVLKQLPLLNEAEPKTTNLREIWLSLIATYFPQRLDLKDYRLVWSRRKRTSCLASCNVEKKRVLIAEVMKQTECLPNLEALLYHEMCHAVLGKPKLVRGRRSVHGRDFHKLEAEHPDIKILNRWIKAGGWREAVRRNNRKGKKTKNRSKYAS